MEPTKDLGHWSSADPANEDSLVTLVDLGLAADAPAHRDHAAAAAASATQRQGDTVAEDGEPSLFGSARRDPASRG